MNLRNQPYAPKREQEERKKKEEKSVISLFLSVASHTKTPRCGRANTGHDRSHIHF
jgi:hypothetical protein